MLSIRRYRRITQPDNAKHFSNVGNFVAVKASKNHKIQKISPSSLQQVRYQSLENFTFQQSLTKYISLYEAWDERWLRDRHTSKIATWQQRLRNLKLEHNEHCTDN
jgi:hypothetical protein